LGIDGSFANAVTPSQFFHPAGGERLALNGLKTLASEFCRDLVIRVHGTQAANLFHHGIRFGGCSPARQENGVRIHLVGVPADLDQDVILLPGQRHIGYQQL
jgi:hypothetical protein